MKYRRFEELPVWKDAIEFGRSYVRSYGYPMFSRSLWDAKST
jgi:hypothetical protein